MSGIGRRVPCCAGLSALAGMFALSACSCARADEAAAAQATAERPPKWRSTFVPAGFDPGEPGSAVDGSRLIEGMDKPPSDTTDTRRGHLVVVPIPFRSELLGAGLTVGVGYLYKSKDLPDSARHSVAGVGGMYAERDSWAGLAGHRGYWSNERYRTTIGLAKGEIVYDLELDVGGNNGTLSVAQEFEGGTIDAAFRVGPSGWLGIGFLYGETTVRLRRADVPPPANVEPDSRITLGNLKLTGEWDSRDSDLYPRTGYRAEAEGLLARTQWGSDDDYESLELQYNGYRPVNDKNVLAWRVFGKIVGGNAPFFAMAWFGADPDLRGYTPGRYIGKSMVSAQLEWRWQATQRWGFVAFGGAGSVSDALGDIETDSWLPAGGAGIRFRLLKSLDLNMRADFAWGRDDSTFTLAVGEAF